MWLREINGAGGLSGVSSAMLTSIDPTTGVLNLATQGINAGISMRGFATVTQQLNQMQGMLSVTTAASILSLGISAIGFTVISKRLKEMEKRWQKADTILIDTSLEGVHTEE